jgi:hypothetical protein
MIPPVLLWLASLLLRVVCAIARPSSMRCPPHWWPNGIRTDGTFACAQPLTGDPDRDGTYGTQDVSVEPDGVLDGRIYCDDGEQPCVTWNGSAVRCEAKGTI